MNAIFIQTHSTTAKQLSEEYEENIVMTKASCIKMTIVSAAMSALFMGSALAQAGATGGGGGGSSGGNSGGSEAFSGPRGSVPSNTNRIAPPPRDTYPHPHPDPRPEVAQGGDPDYRGCVGEQRTSRNSTNQKGCDNRRLRAIVQ